MLGGSPGWGGLLLVSWLSDSKDILDTVPDLDLGTRIDVPLAAIRTLKGGRPRGQWT